MLKAEAIQFAYTNEVQFSFPDIQLETGEQALILGASGCGKSTLLHVLAGILAPNGGHVAIDGNDLYSMSERHRDQLRGEKIGVVFQQAHLLQGLNVMENVSFAAHLAKSNTSSKDIDALLEQLGIGHRKKAKIYTLSQGEQQRVAIARAMVHQPKVLLADEPTSALDDASCNEVIQLLQNLSTQMGAALLVVTHDQRLKDVFHQHILL